ncbi:16S rRNA (guanine(966)-N(2))-methyltransferase RsmD [Trichloromonas sp.]|uniref:16S rRNA (guanine(966)-N(2))-methyltransferase RsmD n=1 Tax=Trichloromonas sp. TaxID=3069249 RepID=UPI002A40559F|nr:16S rRNA (guanine(966)-N(2))-methyltransferase RsmD [Trichloromonas sp.]
MRIISGTARGKRLTTFAGDAIRPTPDKVRGAIFSMLYSRLGPLEGMKVLDLFAGTGALAIEALSRGAAHAWLVDAGRDAGLVIPANVRACGLENRATLVRAEAGNALSLLEKDKPFDLIFLDPPYGRDLLPSLLRTLAANRFLAPNGVLCAETGKSEILAETFAPLARVDERTYGITRIHLYSYPEPEE